MSDTAAEKSGREMAVEALCDQSRKILGVFTIAVVFLLIQVPYLFVVDQDSSLFVVATLNIIGSGGFAVVSGSALWFCSQQAD
ncbi:hypothetical protein ACFQMA_23005 [Halosimplex aquaticum]|uniref:Uncharacterized protein n=1 Tax=Halosimplex aquaticum TaxID=3026162 RepID=A0ABD5YBI3_9EURY|nr:hypothetical protein [Halosimplex aquaticum]